MLPNLVHPVPVTMEPIDRVSTPMNRRAREPVQAAARAAAVIVIGQLSASLRIKAQRNSRLGRVEGEEGYVLFRVFDLNAKGVDLQEGDRVTKIGIYELNVYVHRVEPVGNYPDQSGPSLLKAFLRDRAEAKGTARAGVDEADDGDDR